MNASTWNVLVPAVGTLLVVATYLPLASIDHWAVAALCFPRLYLALIGLALLLVAGFGWSHLNLASRLVLLPVATTVLFQAVWIFPYTPFARSQVPPAGPDAPRRITLLVANVFMENRRTGSLVELVRSLDPDILVTLESDAHWAEALSELDGRWPHRVAVPMDNTYGMTLHSRLELVDPRVDHLVLDDVPSITATVPMGDGREVRLTAVHPRPPVPGEALQPSERNAELLIVARREREKGGPAIVLGDLNAVAWSPVTTLFQRVSGLLDPRVGRGFYGTWNSRWPGWRFPLDHVLHSEHFGFVRMSVHAVPGSDHFAVLVELALSDRARGEAEPPEEAPGDLRQARETIRTGLEATGD